MDYFITLLENYCNADRPCLVTVRSTVSLEDMAYLTDRIAALEVEDTLAPTYQLADGSYPNLPL